MYIAIYNFAQKQVNIVGFEPKLTNDSFAKKNSLGNQDKMTPSFKVNNDANQFFDKPVKPKNAQRNSNDSGSGFIESEIVKTTRTPGAEDHEKDQEEMMKNSSTVRFGSRYKKQKSNKIGEGSGGKTQEHSFGRPNTNQDREIENLNPELREIIAPTKENNMFTEEDENSPPMNDFFQNVLEGLMDPNTLAPTKRREDYKGTPGMEIQYGHLYKDDNLTVISERQSVMQSNITSNPMGFSQGQRSSDTKSGLMASSPYFESGINVNTPKNHKNRFAYSGNEHNNTHFGNYSGNIMKSDLVVPEKRFSGVGAMFMK